MICRCCDAPLLHQLAQERGFCAERWNRRRFPRVWAVIDRHTGGPKRQHRFCCPATPDRSQ
jgi:hypothetical protein